MKKRLKVKKLPRLPAAFFILALLASVITFVNIQTIRSYSVYSLFADIESAIGEGVTVIPGSKGIFIAWKTDDNKIITVIPQISVSLFYKCDPADEPSSAVLAKKDIETKIKPLLLRYGYRENAQNHHGLGYKEAWGFVKDDYICEIFQEQYCGYDGKPTNVPFSSVHVSCTNTLSEAYRQQAPILNDLDYHDGRFILNTEEPDNTMSFWEWAKLDVGSIERFLMHSIILRKVDGRWVEVYSGPNKQPPPCKLVKREQIPFYMAPTCIDDTEARPNVWSTYY
jgi:hypothetical protein